MNEQRRMISCDEHGPQPETFVCQHILQSLHTQQPVGFFWAIDSNDDRPDAWCEMCNEAVRAAGGEWTPAAERIADPRLLCGKCYDEARRLNLNAM